MASVASFPVSTTVPAAEQARRIVDHLARHSAVIVVGRNAQGRQLRCVQGALRAAGYAPHYFSDGARHLLTVEPPGPPSRALTWWGPSG